MDEFDEVETSEQIIDNTSSIEDELISRSQADLTRMTLDPLFQSILYCSFTEDSLINYIQIGDQYIESLWTDEDYEQYLEYYPQVMTDIKIWFIDRIAEIYNELLNFDVREVTLRQDEDILSKCYQVYDIIASVVSNIPTFIIRRYIDRNINKDYLIKHYRNSMYKLFNDSIIDFINTNIMDEDVSIDNPIYGHILEEDILVNAKSIFSSSQLVSNILLTVMRLVSKNIERIETNNLGKLFKGHEREYDNFSIVHCNMAAMFMEMFENEYLTKRED